MALPCDVVGNGGYDNAEPLSPAMQRSDENQNIRVPGSRWIACGGFFLVLSVEIEKAGGCNPGWGPVRTLKEFNHM